MTKKGDIVERTLVLENLVTQVKFGNCSSPKIIIIIHLKEKNALWKISLKRHILQTILAAKIVSSMVLLYHFIKSRYGEYGWSGEVEWACGG